MLLISETSRFFRKKDIEHVESRKFLNEKNEDYLEYIKNEKESFIGKIPNKRIKKYSARSFEDVWHERSLIMLLSLPDLSLVKQIGLMDD